MITIRINEKDLEIPANTNINQLLALTQSPEKGIAIAINDSIIPSSEWSDVCIQQNDTILIIQATQGG
jgi:sulfur carrier protein